MGKAPLAHHGAPTAIPLYVGAMSSGTTNKCSRPFRCLRSSSGSSPPQLERRLPWCSAGAVVNALTSMTTTICIFDIATDDMPQSRVSASSPLLYFFFSLLSPFPSSKLSIYCKSMDTHLHPSQRQALAPNCDSVSGDFASQGSYHPNFCSIPTIRPHRRSLTPGRVFIAFLLFPVH